MLDSGSWILEKSAPPPREGRGLGGGVGIRPTSHVLRY
jgi:hypothetical protein